MRSLYTLKTIGSSTTRALYIGLVATLGLLAGTSLQASDDLEISDVWARESPPTVTNAAVYMTIRNLSTDGDRLVGVSTGIAKKSELHTHEKVELSKEESDEHDMKHEKHDMKHDMSKHTMMKMRQVDSIEIPAAGVASLQPGGLHVMLFDIDAPLKDQQSFDLSLAFERAGNISVTVLVKKPAQ